MGFNITTYTAAMGYNPMYNNAGFIAQDTSATSPVGFFSWMYDIASNPAAPQNMALLAPMIRHNPFLYASWGNMSDWNNWPQIPVVNPNRFITGQPRSGQFNGSSAIAIGNPNWIGGAWAGGFDELIHSYYRPLIC